MNNNSQGDIDASRAANELRALLEKDLPGANISALSDSLIFRSLMFADFDVEKSSEFLKCYIKLRKSNEEYFVKSGIEKFKNVYSKMLSTVQNAGLNGECLIVFTISKWDPDEVDIKTLLSAFLFAFECLSLDDDINQNGIHFIGDSQGVGWKQVKACSLNPMLVQTFLKLLTSSPVNLKMILSYNTNWAIDLVYKLISPLLPQSICDRIVLASEAGKLAKYLGEDVSSEKLKPNHKDRKAFHSLIEEKTVQVLEEWAVLDQCL